MKTGACPRCGGVLFKEQDIYGMRLVCVQCGYDRLVELIDPVKAGVDVHVFEKHYIPSGVMAERKVMHKRPGRPETAHTARA